MLEICVLQTLFDLPVTELGKQFYAFLKEHELVTEEGRLDSSVE